MDLTFESVTVKTREGRELLSNVSGSALPGTFTSLMGASGSGKTTLLSTLSRRFEANLLYSGNIRYSGKKFTNANRRAIAFVQQDDIVPAYLTVFEHLTFSSKLRLDMSDEDRQARVEKVIAQLRLEKCRNTLLGGPMQRGVSGGERKRASIANELLTEPQILLTDEVTSGLDSTLSSVVVDILKELARENNLTVITTIHSPSSSIFERFDTLIVLDEGKVFYRGQAKDLVNFLTNTLGRAVPGMFNPADYIMDILVLEKERKKDERILTAMETFAAWSPEESSSAQAVTTTSNGNNMTKRKSYRPLSAKRLARNVSVIFRPGQVTEEDAADQHGKYARSFWMQTALLTRRMWRRYRQDIFTTNQIGSTLGLAIISGVMFFQLGYSEAQIFSRVALALWLVGTDMYLGVFSTVFALHDDVPLLKKELYDGSYSLAAHVLAKQIVVYPNSGLWSLVFCTLVLLATRLAPSVGAGVLAILTVQMELFLFQGVGFIISAGVPASGLVVVCVVAVTYFFAFNGFFQPFALMAPWYGWLRWTCFLQYSYQLVMRIVFPEYPHFECAQAPALSAYQSCALPNGTITGTDVLNQYGVDISVGTSIGVLLGAAVFFRVLAYFIYLRKMQPPKGITDEGGSSRRCCLCCRRSSNKVKKTEEDQVKPDEKPNHANGDSISAGKDDVVNVV